MELALEEARSAAKYGEVPVGAIVVASDSSRIVARAGNRMEKLNDPTAHAEILAIRQATIERGETYLGACDLYVTLEP